MSQPKGGISEAHCAGWKFCAGLSIPSFPRRRESSFALKLRGMRLRACWILLTIGRSFSPSATYFLSTATRSRQETPPRSLRPAIGFFCKFTLPSMARHRAFSNPRPGHPWPGVRALWSDIESLHKALTPALRSRSGVHRQAIPGLTMDASASCLAPRQQARAHVAPTLRCSAQTTGRGVKSNIKSQSNGDSAKQHQKPATSIFVIPAKAGIQGV